MSDAFSTSAQTPAPPRSRSALAALKRAALSFIDDDALTLSASLAFYTALSFAPMMTIALWVASSVSDAAQSALIGQVGALFGASAADAAAAVIDHAAQRPTLGSVAGLLGIAIVLIAATTVFAQLQFALNVIWKAELPTSNLIRAWLRRRLLSVGLLAATLFVLAVSLVISTALGLLKGHGWFWQIVHPVFSLMVFGLLFATLFRYLPDRRLPWRRTASGAFMTAALFALGELVISLYLTGSGVGTAYGSSGSMVVFLIWVYYSSAIFLFGAELIKAVGPDDVVFIPPASASDHKVLGGA